MNLGGNSSESGMSYRGSTFWWIFDFFPRTGFSRGFQRKSAQNREFQGPDRGPGSSGFGPRIGKKVGKNVPDFKTEKTVFCTSFVFLHIFLQPPICSRPGPPRIPNHSQPKYTFIRRAPARGPVVDFRNRGVFFGFGTRIRDLGAPGSCLRVRFSLESRILRLRDVFL